MAARISTASFERADLAVAQFKKAALLLGVALVAFAHSAVAQTAPVTQPTTTQPPVAAAPLPVATVAEPTLEDLIPDSAVADPLGWVRQAPAVATAAPDAVLALDPGSPLAPLPDLQLAWPDDQLLPPVDPLSPEPDIQLAEDTAEKELAAAGIAPGEAVPRLVDAKVEDLGKGVELGFPAGTETAGREEIASRFAALSTLRRLRDDKDNIAQVARRGRSDRDLLLRTLRNYGYYDAEVYQTLAGVKDGDNGGDAIAEPGKVKVRFDVIPGPRYVFGAIALGDLAATGDDYASLRAAFDIQPGEPVVGDTIVTQQADLSIALGETGYAFAHVGEPDLLIDHARRGGDLTLPVTPAGKYSFGAVNSALPKFLSSGHLASIARFDPGDLYQKSKVDDLRRAILATGLVSSVTVTPRETQKPAVGDAGSRELGTVDLDVALTKAKLRTIAGLVGFSSGEGFRVEASWEHRNLFPPEGLLRVRGVAGTQEQLAGVTFRRNNVWGRDRVLSVDLFAQTQDRDAFQARTVSFITTFERQSTILYQKRWSYGIGLEAVATQEREGTVNGIRAPRQTFFIGALPGHVLYDASDDLLDPKKGFRAGIRLSPEYSKINGGGSATYIKAQFDGSYYQPVSDKIVLAGRARLGTITGADITQIAPSRRFYAGGGGSVRGYGYQQIGPRNSVGDPSGGRSLSELSFEARVRTGYFGGALAVVPFVDAGAVDTTTTPSFQDLRFGAGIGIRYYTNFGPLRIDVGTPLNRRKGDSRIGVYVALGQAF